MYNPIKLKILTTVGVVLLAIIAFVGGLSVGSFTASQKESGKIKAVQKAAEKQEKNQKEILTEKIVQEFLIAYYTKKDLEENRNRYKPLMTDEAYNAQISIEDEPVNQAYKGYMVDQAFEEADIFINSEKNLAICNVKYSNTQLSIKNKRDKDKLSNQMNDATIKLTFEKSGDKFLVNNISQVTLTDTAGDSAAITDTPQAGTFTFGG